MIEDPTIKFFIQSGEQRAPKRYGRRPFSHAVARLRLRVTQDEDWVIVTDDQGLLYRARPDRVQLLPPAIRTELANFDLLFTPVGLDLEALYLFSIEAVEPAADLDGLNDPLYLRGCLVGPFPSATPGTVEGRLTVTRGDLLTAIVQSARDAFPCSSPAETQVVPGRWHHVLLPAGGVEDIRAGRGVVFGVPMSRVGLELGQPGNQDQVEEILGDLLSALRLDAIRSNPDSALARLPLPRSLGASAAGASNEGSDRGLFSRLLGGDRSRAKPDGPTGLPALLALAQEAIAHLPGWPNPRARALRGRIRLRTAEWSSGQAHGITLVASPALTLSGGVAALSRAKKQPGPLTLTLTLEAAFASWQRGDVEVEVECGDDTGTLDLELAGSQGHRRSASGPIVLGGTRGFRRLTFTIPGAGLSRGQDDAGSLRLVLDGGSALRIRRIAARSSGPEPAVPRASSASPESAALNETPQRATPQPASAPVHRPRRVFLHDPRCPEGWVHDLPRVAEAALRRGFALLDPAVLERWMELTLSAKDAPGSVVILPGIAPDAIVEVPNKTCLLRRYLDAGGRVVWIGDTPLHARTRADGTLDPDWSPAHREVLDVGPPGPPAKGPVIITDDGCGFGLVVPDVARRPHATAEVTVVLSRAVGRWAGSWLKNYNPSHPMSGFLRLRAGVFQGANAALVEDLLRAATHRL